MYSLGHAWTDRWMDRKHCLNPHCINTCRIFKYFIQLTCNWQAELDRVELSRCTCDRGQRNRQRQTRPSSSWGVPATSHMARYQMFETIPTQHIVGMDYIPEYILYSHLHTFLHTRKQLPHPTTWKFQCSGNHRTRKEIIKTVQSHNVYALSLSY